MFKSGVHGEIVYNLYKMYDLPQNIIEKNHWHIPLTFTQSFSNNSTLKRRWLGNSSEPAVYTDVIEKPNSWIICNHKVFGKIIRRFQPLVKHPVKPYQTLVTSYYNQTCIYVYSKIGEIPPRLYVGQINEHSSIFLLLKKDSLLLQ